MAVVYLAERADGEFEQQVAVKLIKRGIDTDEVMRRFAQERQILAQARHPGVARLLDAGTTEDGRPYFVMEHVDGRPIDVYCDEERLTVEQRLRLFQQVAEAVAYAHRNLVVHRDIKPSNILVTSEGEAKLLDFGIARFLDEDAGATRTKQRFLTPAYASPEQLAGEPVTTASDIYQLGLLLCRLLSGSGPYDTESSSPSQIEDAVLNKPPRRPSVMVTSPSQSAADPAAIGRARRTTPEALRRELLGDLDTIVLTCLRREPDRRYPSTAQLIDDVERYLTGRPVTARPDTLSYRFGKLIRRHKVTAAMAAIALMLLVGFALSMTVLSARLAAESARAEAAKDRAEENLTTARRVTGFLVDLFKIASPEQARGEEITAREMLDRGTAKLETELLEEPVARAMLLFTLGRVYTNLGEFDKARTVTEECVAIRRQELGDRNVHVAAALDNLGWILEYQGEYKEAEAIYRETLSIYRTAEGAEERDVATSLNNLANALFRQDRFNDAEPVYEEALRMRDELRLDEDLGFTILLNNYAVTLQEQGDLEGPEPLMRRSLEISRRLVGEEHPDVSAQTNNLALLLKERGDYEAAEPLARRAVEIDRKLLGDGHPNVGISINNLADLLYHKGDMAEAAELFGESKAIFEKTLPESHWLVGLARSNYGDALAKVGRHGQLSLSGAASD